MHPSPWNGKVELEKCVFSVRAMSDLQPRSRHRVSTRRAPGPEPGGIASHKRRGAVRTRSSIPRFSEPGCDGRAADARNGKRRLLRYWNYDTESDWE